MARLKNELSDVQQNEQVFEGLKAKIQHYTPDKLAEFDLASRTTFFKWMRPEAINPRMEEAILMSLELADKNAKIQSEQKLSRAAQLAEVTY